MEEWRWIWVDRCDGSSWQPWWRGGRRLWRHWRRRRLYLRPSNIVANEIANMSIVVHGAVITNAAPRRQALRIKRPLLLEAMKAGRRAAMRREAVAPIWRPAFRRMGGRIAALVCLVRAVRHREVGRVHRVALSSGVLVPPARAEPIVIVVACGISHLRPARRALLARPLVAAKVGRRDAAVRVKAVRVVVGAGSVGAAAGEQ